MQPGHRKTLRLSSRSATAKHLSDCQKYKQRQLRKTVKQTGGKDHGSISVAILLNAQVLRSKPYDQIETDAKRMRK